MSESIYRYRKIDKYNMLNLINDEIYASSPVVFNDPYDALCAYSLKDIWENLSEDKDSIQAIADDIRIIYPELKLDLGDAKEILYENRAIFVNKCALDALDRIRRGFVVASFSKFVQTEIMWSHYANSGTGFALEYERDKIENLAKEYIKNYQSNSKKHTVWEDCSVFGFKEVLYNSTRFDGSKIVCNQIKTTLASNSEFKKGKLIPDKYSLDANAFNELVYKKHESWKYENELRLVVPSYDSRQTGCKIGKIRPKAIYLGEFMSFNDTYNICSIAMNKKLPVYKMVSKLGGAQFGLTKRAVSDKELEAIVKDFKEVNFYD